MKIYNSYDASFRAAVASQRFTVAQLQTIQLPMNIDTSGCYKLFFFLSGEKKFHIDDFVYNIHPGDLFFVNQREWHYFSQIKETDHHDRIVIFIYPDYLKGLCTAQTDLCRCFLDRAGPIYHQIKLTAMEQERFTHLVSKLATCSGFGEDILANSLFSELMVYLNRCLISRSNTAAQEIPESLFGSRTDRSNSVGRIIAYIDEHITEELSLSHLSAQFYISPSYLCRVFKNHTGTTIHKYLTAKRITLAKDLLSQGYSVSEACNASGFKDYNGFLKSFVDSVGISPKKYATIKK